jgi:hypothetical protein
MMRRAFRFSVSVAALAALAGSATAAPASSPRPASLDFNRDIRPILSRNCFPCHGQDEKSRMAGLRLDRREFATAGVGGRRAVVPGNPTASRMVVRTSAKEPAQRMPPPGSGHALTAREIRLLRQWIAEGAPYAEHWAFQKPKRPALPHVKSAGWARNPIDAFILARLEAAGLKPSPEASRHTLIRRLSLDLTGLPPSPEEVRAFVTDSSPNAYERLVDRLLASPHFGERWARMWLDLARYADSAGYGSDPLRLNIWPYRDWVIDAFNRNLPYDRFTLLQIAGDLFTDVVRSGTSPSDDSPDVARSGTSASDDGPRRSGGDLSGDGSKDRRSRGDRSGDGSKGRRTELFAGVDRPLSNDSRNVLPADAEVIASRATLSPAASRVPPPASFVKEVATAFHRNTMTNTEGGTDDEEFRVAAVKDRIATTAQVWMGLTLGCAQCHSHKYDPISQKEYYRFFAFFNQTEDNDQPDESPTMPVPTPEEAARSAVLTAEIEALTQKIEAPTPQFAAELAAWEQELAARAVPWTPLVPVEARAANGTNLSVQADGSVLAGGPSPETETYTLKLRAPLAGITALRLELLPDESLPKNGPGRTAEGNLVLTDLRVSLLPALAKPAVARYVRIENSGTSRILSLAEVEVFSGGANIAGRGTASQSSTDYEGPAEKGIDGNTDGDYFAARSTTHTATEDNPWWEVDLGAEVPIEAIAVWNRTDGGLGTRLTNFRVQALAADRQVAWETRVAEAPSPTVRLGTAGEQRVKLKNATSTFDQDGFDAAKAIDESGKSGWAIGGQTGRAHAAVWETATPVAEEGAQLTVTLGQAHGGQHTLGRFRLLATGAPAPVREVPHAIREILGTAPENRTEAQRQALAAYFRPLAPSLASLYREREEKQKALAAIKPVELPVMRELPLEKRRVTHVMNKGNFLDPGETVSAGVPAAFHPLPPGAPPNRLGLAEWLVSRENPLTARVAVNRFWSQLFGTGIVVTEEDFGTQGSLPSHPELLDWLAVEFMEGGWDVKALLKRIVTSATYRQSSAATSLLREKDPRDRLLGRYPRRRLDAEFVRDQALALSGLLSHKIGGPSVYPPQPEGLWQAAFNGERTWPTSKGEDRYRRGLYTFWRRTVPYPSMATFDAPSREICTVRRLPTNTPLQALVTLNDPAYVEMAQALARRIMRDGGPTAVTRARFGLELALARPARPAQVSALVRLYEQERAHYRRDPDPAGKLATDPLGPLPDGLDLADAAAWTVVANVLLNLDGVLTKG